MPFQAFVLTRTYPRDMANNRFAYERFVSILPSCGFSVTTGAIQPARGIFHTCFINADYSSTNSLLGLPIVDEFQGFNKVIFNVCEDDVELQFHALERGINGIFHVNDSLELIVRGVQQIQNGTKWFSREVMSRYIDENILNNSSITSLPSGSHTILTRKEYAITRKIAEGAQNQEIADDMHISVNTVKTHVYSIFRKTDCRNRVELIRWLSQQSADQMRANSKAR